MAKKHKKVTQPLAEIPEEISEESVEQISNEILEDYTSAPQNDVQYIQVVYLGNADRASRFGLVTGDKYVFIKDEFGMPTPTEVDSRDVPGLVSEIGKGCARRDPSRMFMTQEDYEADKC